MEHSSVDIRISWEKHSWSVSIDINTLKDMRSSALKKASAYYFPSLAIWTKVALERGGGVFSKGLLLPFTF